MITSRSVRQFFGVSTVSALAIIVSATMSVEPPTMTAPNATFATADSPLAASGARGTVKNRSSFDIKITNGWCEERALPCSNKTISTLKAGRTSSGDIDGYEVPPGRRYSVLYDEFVGSDRRCVGPGWHKIGNTTVAKVDRTC